MDTRDIIQEEQYDFPYHFIPDVEHDAIVTNRFLQWSMVYMSYIQFVRDEIIASDAQSILDVGCGDGRLLYELERVDANRQYTGIDISKRALQFAQGFTKHSCFEIFDIIERPHTTQHDLIAYIETIEHIPPEKIPPMVANMAASLRDGGTLLLTTPTTNLPTAKKHYQHFTRESLMQYLGDHFEIVEVRYFNVENWLAKLLARILVNRIITINTPRVRKAVYQQYLRHCFEGTKNTGSRIFIKARKR